MKDIIQELLCDISLESKLSIINEMCFIKLITELGYRENLVWKDTLVDNNKLEIICSFARKLAKEQLKEIESNVNC